MARKPKLPFDTIKIGYIEAKVSGISSREASKREIYGEFFAKEHEIDYDEDMVDSEKINTILHETLHGVIHVFGIKFRDHEQEEEIVNSLGGALTTLIKDNPKLFRWIMSVLHEEEN